MSKAAANMAGKLLSQELKAAGISVSILHPGFNRTDMTSKYKDIWDENFIFLYTSYSAKITKNLDTTKDIVVSFDYACYGSQVSGSEGFCLFFIDSNAYAVNGGGPGPGLCYTPTFGITGTDNRNQPATIFSGVYLGQLGIGFDLTGNYGTSAYGVNGYQDGVPNSVSIRGSQNFQYSLYYNSGSLASSAAPATLSLYQQVTSTEDIQFYTVRVRLTDFCKTILIDWKQPGDHLYTNYITTSLPEEWPATVNCCLGFATGLSDTTFTIKNFNVNGIFTSASAAPLTYTWTYSSVDYFNQFPNPAVFTVLDTIFIQNAVPWNNYPTLINVSQGGLAPLQNDDGYIIINYT
jgi:hypothetical protein